MNSDLAILCYSAKKERIIQSNAQFWREYSTAEKLKGLLPDREKYAREIQETNIDLVCVFDKNFPPLSAPGIPSERPYFFAYRGDISLLDAREKNFAVVGTLTPSEAILKREDVVLYELVERGYRIVSGLAAGCDSAAHSGCLACGGKTIAFLPSALSDIYPKENAKLAERIVQSGGLVLTEYVTKPASRFDLIRRFIERDRLQAMFAEKILLIASHLPGEGDSGSRHAMDKAKRYGTQRFVLYNPSIDEDDSLFALNRKYIDEGAKIFTKRAISIP